MQINLLKAHVTLAPAQAGLTITYGNHPYLGVVVGVDDDSASAWLLGELSKLSPLNRTVRDPDFPCSLAFQITKVNCNPPH